MASIKEKMILGQLYNASEPILVAERAHAHTICHHYNSTPNCGSPRESTLQPLFGQLGKNVLIEPPFFCDYGYNIFLDDDVYFNFNCTILDCAPVRIGKGVKFGPGVQVYTAGHPINPSDRAQGLEYALSITIEANVWVGGGSILLPGVHIGCNTVIGAGSVVTKSLPANVVAVGNPCRVIKSVSASEAAILQQ
ncbi:MAG: sugar O-acetyltransferase [Cyanobacteria bacterium P01_H01_bin.58]